MTRPQKYTHELHLNNKKMLLFWYINNWIIKNTFVLVGKILLRDGLKITLKLSKSLKNKFKEIISI